MAGYPYVAHLVAKAPRANWWDNNMLSDQRILFTSKRGGVWHTATVASAPDPTTEGGGWHISVAHKGSEFLLLVTDWPVWPALRIYRSVDEGVSWSEVPNHNLGGFPAAYRRGRVFCSRGNWVFLTDDAESFQSPDGITWRQGAHLNYWVQPEVQGMTMDASGRLYMFGTQTLSGTPTVHEMRVVVSADGGDSWTQRVIGENRAVTPYTCHALGNAVVAVSHSWVGPGEGEMELSVTEDGGETWAVNRTPMQTIWPDLKWFGSGTRNYSEEYLGAALIGGRLYANSSSVIHSTPPPDDEDIRLISAVCDNWRSPTPTWTSQPHASHAVACGWDGYAWADDHQGVGGSLLLFAPRRGDVWWSGEAWLALGLFDADPTWATPGTEVFSLTPGGTSDVHRDLLITWSFGGHEVFTRQFLWSSTAGWHEGGPPPPPPLPPARVYVGDVAYE